MSIGAGVMTSRNPRQSATECERWLGALRAARGWTKRHTKADPFDTNAVGQEGQAIVFHFLPTHLCGLVKFIHRGFALPVTVPQRFQSHMEANLVAILETVGHGFGRSVNAHCNTLYFFRQHAVFERGTGKAHDAQRRMVLPR